MHNKKQIAYKGFDKNWKCRGHQFEIGMTYEQDGDIVICQNGFHACDYPLDIFNYYAPADSVFAEVTLYGDVKTHDSDTKLAAAKITINAELKLPDIIQRSVDWILKRIDSTKSENEEKSIATNTGDWSAATNTGYRSAATNTGYWSAATVEGKNSVAIATGSGSKAKASLGSAIVLCSYDDNGNLKHIRSAITGYEIKPDTFYTLDQNGEFIEIKN